MISIERKTTAGCASHLRPPIYQRNLMFLKSTGTRLTARFATAMKDPGHALGKLFSKHDLGRSPAFVKAFQNRDRDQVSRRLQYLFMSERILVKGALGDIYRANRLLGSKAAEAELRKEDPAIEKQRWEAVRRKVEEKLQKMSPKAKAKYQASVRRALFSLIQEQLAPKEAAPPINIQGIEVSAGPDGRLTLDLISATFLPEILKETH